MRTILIIEDDKFLLENMTQMLDMEGFRTLLCSNGKEGLTLAKKEKPDLILCDIMMPKMDGYQVLKILSRQAETMDIPFIFITAKATRYDLRHGMELGADDYITKPFTQKELIKAINARVEKYERLAKLRLKNTENGNGTRLLMDKKFQALEQKLAVYCSQLTPTEIKICGYLRMNFNSKEIADFMVITPKSVEQHRYRIRKKLQIPRNTSIYSFLVNL